ncbi:DUF4173 domain-containing protein [Aureisphaera galaxeae]|uniref:DUF4153 domain-containing protein n=1 Tax=Aureisphaera galaxeae TaxID=1538023 RepID=UPI00234FE1AD|nr:DUF4173 domain-containing protein [Aureisphaera galaxeae]MDC8005269.1 DUF4173 domain-containing protein [Aureisphaera galaxeae]
MNLKSAPSVVCISAVLITLLFYKQGIGLNLFLFETLFFLALLLTKQFSLKNREQLITGLGFVLTSLFTVISYSIYGYVIHFLALFLFVGSLNFAKARSLVSVAGIAGSSLFTAPIAFVRDAFHRWLKGKKAGKVVWKSRIFIAPIFIIILFIGIYSFANAKFGSIMGNVGTWIQKGVNFLFTSINFGLVFTFIFSLFLGAFLWMRTKNKSLELKDRNASETLVRTRQRLKRYFKLNALSNEYRAGVFLLVVLNLLLLLLNGLDIYWVWFNFEWNGSTLKEFVHEGTYFLILSILISIAVVLYFFRGNLNFYKKNKLLLYLSYAWLIQNAILTISVGIRNYQYIEYFALAYKRIGVILFLLLTLFGLYTVFFKIKYKKSAFYLFKTNALALYAVLVVSSLANWDRIIADYNFSNANESYVHLDFLKGLSDKSLPSLDISVEALREMDTFQKSKFLNDRNEVSYVGYYRTIQRRKTAFKNKWEAKNWLSWNLAEYRAYEELFGH